MLSTKQRKCLELMVLGTMTQKKIASQINITEKTICEWKKNDEFRKEFDHLIRISIQSLAASAYKTQQLLLYSKNDMVRHLAAKDLLDRAGFKATDKLEIEGAIPIIIQDDMGDSDDVSNT